MEESKLIVRVSKTSRIFFTSGKYELKIPGADDFSMNYLQHTKTYQLSSGKHRIEIKSENSSETKELVLEEGKTKILTINPVAGSNQNGKGAVSNKGIALMILGFSITTLIFMFSFFENVPIPSIFLILLPSLYFFFKKDNPSEELGDFHITIRNKALNQ